MSYPTRTRDQHLANDGKPKRILALDGGGLRGILSLGLLQAIEDTLRTRHGAGDDFRLSHYFDLIAGTSTGAIIAATLALGWKVEEIRSRYMMLGERVFTRSLLRQGVLRAKYDDDTLIAELKKVYGAKTTLGGPELKTGLLVMTKRIDTGSPWPISTATAFRSARCRACTRAARTSRRVRTEWSGTATIRCGRWSVPLLPRPPISIRSRSRSRAPPAPRPSRASSSMAASARSTTRR